MDQISNELGKNLSTTLTNTEYATAVGSALETEGSGAAGIKDTFVNDFTTAIGNYINGVKHQITALKTALDEVGDLGLYGPEISNAVSTLFINLETSLNDYSDAVQQAETDIIAEVGKMFTNVDESISTSMDADSALLATGETPTSGNEPVGTNPEIMPNTPMTSGDEVPVASRGGGGRRVTQMLYAPYKPPQLYPSTGPEGEYDWRYFAHSNTTPEETQKAIVDSAQKEEMKKVEMLQDIQTKTFENQQDRTVSQAFSQDKKFGKLELGGNESEKVIHNPPNITDMKDSSPNTYEQLRYEGQKAEMERWKILQETRDKVFEMQRDALGQGKTQDKMIGKWDEYIRV